ILEQATSICNAMFGVLDLYDGDAFRSVAHFDTPTALLEALTRRGPFKPPPGSPFDQVMQTRKVFRSADNAADPVPSLAAKIAGARSLAAVPISKTIGCSALSSFTVRKSDHSPTSRSRWSGTLPIRPSSPSRTRGYLMNCMNLWSSRRQPRSAARHFRLTDK